MTAPADDTPPERTGLAWQRTGLGVLGVAGLLANDALRAGSRAVLVLAVGVAALGVVVFGGLARLRYRALRRAVSAGTTTQAPRLVLAVTVAVVLVGAAAGAAALTQL